MITYSTNWMGPINKQFIDEHGPHWAGGRIDIREHVDLSHIPDEVLDAMDDAEYFSHFQLSPWGEEYGLPIMHAEDFCKLRDWLKTLKTESVLSYDDLITRFETENYLKVRWFTR